MEEKLLDHLKMRDMVSVPELQKVLCCSYTEAREAIAALSEKKLISAGADGLFYAVNTRAFNMRSLARSDCEALSDMLTVAQLSVLADVAERGGDCLESCVGYEDIIQALEEMGLIYKFDGGYFSSLSKEHIEAIYSVREEYIPYTSVLACIAHPILVNCINTGASADNLLRLALMPDECKEYISRGLKRYAENKKCHFAPVTDENSRGKNTIRFDILESFIGALDFDTKEEYNDVFKMELDIVERSGLASDVFKDTVRDAFMEFEDMTLENVKEIHDIIVKKTEE